MTVAIVTGFLIRRLLFELFMSIARASMAAARWLMPRERNESRAVE